MGPTLSPETSAFKLQTPGKFPEEYKQPAELHHSGFIYYYLHDARDHGNKI